MQKFLVEKLKITKHMADTQSALRPVTPKFPKSTKIKSSFNVKAKASQCCVHNSTGHTTEVCKQFASLSVKGRQDALQKGGLCFRCFGGHRRADCKEDSPCGSCGRRSH